MAEVAAIRRLQQNPRRALEAARRGSLQDLTELAKYWQVIPRLFAMGLLDVFFSHLDENKAPSPDDPGADRSAPAGRAFMALLGVSKTGDFISEESPYIEAIFKAWPGIFKWCSLFFATRIKPSTQHPQIRREGMDVISGVLYSICADNRVRKAMVATPGSIEMAAQLWLLENSVPFPSSVEIPVGTTALEAILRKCGSPELDRALKAAGGKPDQVAKLALANLRNENQKSNFHGYRLSVYTDLLNHLSRGPMQPLRNALLIKGSIGVVTKSLTVMSAEVNASDPSILDCLTSSFGYLKNCLQSTDGFTWVSQSVKGGLLTAFVECSPHLSRLDDRDRTMIISIIKDLLPQYMVYRSVIKHVDAAMIKLLANPRKKEILKSPAKDDWSNFFILALERRIVSMQAAAFKGRAATCDNMQCRKVDSKNNFQRCAACGTTLYCSKECQVKSWKEGDHKSMCKLKQRECLEGTPQTITKADSAFLHHLSIYDARRHLSYLRSMAAREYPNVDVKTLVICIDYQRSPTKYTLRPSTTRQIREISEIDISTAARNDAIIEKVTENPEKYTLIESTIAYGLRLQLVTTLVTSFWDRDTGPLGGEGRMDGEGGLEENDEGEDNPKLEPQLVFDEVDAMMLRMTLDQLNERFGSRHPQA